MDIHPMRPAQRPITLHASNASREAMLNLARGPIRLEVRNSRLAGTRATGRDLHVRNRIGSPCRARAVSPWADSAQQPQRVTTTTDSAFVRTGMPASASQPVDPVIVLKRLVRLEVVQGSAAPSVL